MHAKLGLSVGFKLISLIIALLLLSIFVLTCFAVRLFQEDNTLLVQQMNAHSARSIGAELRRTIESDIERANGFLSILANPTNSATRDSSNLCADLFARNADFFGLILVDGESTIKNFTFSESVPTSERELLAKKVIENRRRSADDMGAYFATLSAGKNVFVISLAVAQAQNNSRLYLLVDPKQLDQIFGKVDGVAAYLLDTRGELLSVSDQELIKTGSGSLNLPGLADLVAGNFSNKQLRYVDKASGEVKIASFWKIGLAGLSVITELPESVALEASHRLVKLVCLIAFVVFCSSLLVGLFYSQLLIRPVLRLTEAAKQIMVGRFGTRVPVASSGGDEIVQLSRVFNEMAAGLEERERYRDTFTKFHSEEVAEKLLSGEVAIGGERKEAVILFTDLRGFTTLSEANPPEKVVESLNEYLALVVAIVRKNGGIIDKFIGDSVMATWGIPFLAPNDAHHAVRACLEIREALKSLNTSRTKRGEMELRIGMGLHLGTVIAGNIGSMERMEYTVIGDAVNTAARLESMTKELSTDFLVSQTLRAKLGDKFIFTSRSKIQLRGKTEATEVFTVGQSAGIQSLSA